MGYNIRVHHDAVKFLRELDADTRDRIKLTLRNLENDPFRNRPKADINEMPVIFKWKYKMDEMPGSIESL